MQEKLQLKNAIKLSSKIAIYIPSAVDDGLIQEGINLFFDCFGGATTALVHTYWYNKKQPQQMQMIFAYCQQDALQKNIDIVTNFCERIKQSCKIEDLFLEINNEKYLV